VTAKAFQGAEEVQLRPCSVDWK